MQGVLVTAFGGPDSLDSVGPFMARLMGREPSDALVERAREKYAAIGGGSPLPGIAERIAASVEHHLRDRGLEVVARAGMRYWEPSIERALGELARLGCRRVVTVSLSPLEAKVTCEAYRVAAADAADAAGVVEVCEAASLATAPQYVEFFGHALTHALDSVMAEQPLVLFSAHSLPLDGSEDVEDYVRALRGLADAVAARAGLGPGYEVSDDARLAGEPGFGALQSRVPWLVVFQSKGARGGSWLGPDLLEVMRAAVRAGHDAVAVCPVGFATDHMETLYDLDVAAAAKAVELGLTFVRTRVPNDDDSLVEGIADLVWPLLGAA